MVMIHAYIKNHKLSAVVLAVKRNPHISGMSVTDVRGFGRGRAGGGLAEGSSEAGDFISAVKIEIACEDDDASDVIGAISRAAHTGLRGDGKIYTSPITSAVRISTGEKSTDSTV